MGNEPKAYQLADAFHYLTRDEVDTLILVALGLPSDPVVVNIGAGVGTSAMALLEARDDLTLFTVDTEDGISPFGGLGNERKALENAGIDLGCRYVTVCGDSATIPWGDPLLDLVVLDGDKLQMGRDLVVWWPRVKPGGYMVVHDYGSPVWSSVRNEIDRTLGDGGRLVSLADTLAVFKKEGG